MNIPNQYVVIKKAKLCHNEKLAFIPIAHHYEHQGESKYIKYTCPVCDAAVDLLNTENYDNLNIVEDETDINGGQFVSHQSMSITNCDVCGCNFDWDSLSDYDKRD